jgi:hypothetical protein
LEIQIARPDLADVDPPIGVLKGIKVILINGPPGSGKDTAGESLSGLLGVWPMKFATALKSSVYADHGLSRYLALDHFESVKDIPLPVFHDKSFRQACIHKSEDYMKPTYGDDIFGRLFLRELWLNVKQGLTVASVTDSGFSGEAEALIPHIGAENMLLIRLHAEGRGKTFKGDSRNYISLDGVKTLDLDNNGDITTFLRALNRQVASWLESVPDEDPVEVGVLRTAAQPGVFVRPMAA